MLSPKQFSKSCKTLERAFADFIMVYSSARDIEEGAREIIQASAEHMRRNNARERTKIPFSPTHRECCKKYVMSPSPTPIPEKTYQAHPTRRSKTLLSQLRVLSRLVSRLP